MRTTVIELVILAYVISRDELRTSLNALDANGDGNLSQDEFVQFMMKIETANCDVDSV